MAALAGAGAQRWSPRERSCGVVRHERPQEKRDVTHGAAWTASRASRGVRAASRVREITQRLAEQQRSRRRHTTRGWAAGHAGSDGSRPADHRKLPRLHMELVMVHWSRSSAAPCAAHPRHCGARSFDNGGWPVSWALPSAVLLHSAFSAGFFSNATSINGASVPAAVFEGSHPPSRALPRVARSRP